MFKKVPNKKTGRRKVLYIALSCVAALVAVLFLCVWLLVRNYLAKIDYDHDDVGNGVNVTAGTLTDEEILREIYEEESLSDAENTPDDIVAELESQMQQQIGQDNIAEEDVAQEKSEIIHILLVGCDSRTGGAVGRSDAMILFSINENTEKIHMTSIMRDSYVSIPDKGYNRINTAYALGGGKLLLETIETNLGVDVDHYVAFDFYSFIDVVDTVGGIEINVTEEEVPILNDYVKEMNRLSDRPEETYCLTEPGLQHLNGVQALGYSRIRYVGRDDFQRTERQRLIITKLFEKIKTINLMEMNDLLNVFLPKIKTNLTEEEILSLGMKALSYLTYDLDSLRLPVDGSYEPLQIKGMSVLGIDLEKNRIALKEFVNQ